MKGLLIAIVITALSILSLKYLIGFLFYSFLMFLDNVIIIFISLVALGVIQTIYFYRKLNK